jgi:cytochrome c peroxidase
MRVIFLGLILTSAHASHFQKFHLGRFLFFDKIISGNKNISCATCHHPRLGTSDALSLGIGEGGKGLGTNRTLGAGRHAVHERVPRNSPHLFNRHELKTMFHDGRVHHDEQYPSGISSPAKMMLPEGLDNLLAAQAIFPITSPTEMAGQAGENSIADAAVSGKLAGPKGVWEQVVNRLRSNHHYVELFRKAFPKRIKGPRDIEIQHMGNAIAYFEEHAFKSYKNKYYYYKQNPTKFKLSESEIRGRNVFYGKGKCSSCHSGKIFTNHKFYSIALPPIGAGKGDGYKGLDDYGLAKTTRDRAHRYKFRTPSLLNVAKTAPYGHNGAYGMLEGIIRHHTKPIHYLRHYNPSKAGVVLPSRADLNAKDFVLLKREASLAAIAASSDIKSISINENEIKDLVAFLGTLTDVKYDSKFERFIPDSVPSGLPVDK